jgi:hypothetical protein
MAAHVVLSVGAFALALVFVPRGKPTELDADVWMTDDEECAKRLKTKAAAWRWGKTYFSPYAIEQIEADCAGAKATRFASGEFRGMRPKQEPLLFVRRHRMRVARWE